MQRLLILSLILLSSFAYAVEVRASEITRAVMLSNSCAACHGTDGNSPGAMPSINGKSAQFISRALLDFREGKREATVMGRHAAGYSDDEIALIADYFSTLP